MACNLGAAPAGEEGGGTDIQNGSNKDLCLAPDGTRAQAITFENDNIHFAHNSERTYKGIGAGVINFCYDFFTVNGQPRPSNTAIEQEFTKNPEMKIDLSLLDTTARIVLHEFFHVSWAWNLRPNPDTVGYVNIAKGSVDKCPYSTMKLLPDAWAWASVWARWMKFMQVKTCDLYPKGP